MRSLIFGIMAVALLLCVNNAEAQDDSPAELLYKLQAMIDIVGDIRTKEIDTLEEVKSFTIFWLLSYNLINEASSDHCEQWATKAARKIAIDNDEQFDRGGAIGMYTLCSLNIAKKVVEDALDKA